MDFVRFFLKLDSDYILLNFRVCFCVQLDGDYYKPHLLMSVFEIVLTSI